VTCVFIGWTSKGAPQSSYPKSQSNLALENPSWWFFPLNSSLNHIDPPPFRSGIFQPVMFHYPRVVGYRYRL
jgi:hypothetical protein